MARQILSVPATDEPTSYGHNTAATDHYHEGDQVLLVPGSLRQGQAVSATITVAAEGTNTRAITIQLLQADGRDIASVQHCFIAVFSSAAMTAFATGGSTGLSIGTDGALLTVVAKKLFLATSEADGDIDLVWTDTGTESVSVAVILPNGKVVASTAFANT